MSQLVDDRCRFVLTTDHVKLLGRAYIGWDDCEFGAPAINCKRPYGNSGVIGDMAEILNVPPDDPSEDSYEPYSRATQDRLRALHESLQTALQIILKTQSFVVGTYERTSSWSNDWRFIS